MSKVNFQYQISEDDFLAAFELFEKYRKKTTDKIVGFIIGVVWVMFFIQASDKKPAIAIACGFIILVFYLIFLGKKRLKLEYTNHTFIKQMMDFTLTDEGCLIVSEDSSNFLRWKKVYRYVESDRFWLLYISPHLIQIVPKSAVSGSDAQQFSSALQKHIGERGQVEATIVPDEKKDNGEWM